MTKSGGNSGVGGAPMVAALVALLRNGAIRFGNALATALPGERPEWLLLELRGSFPARRMKRSPLSLEALSGQERTLSQEELTALVTALIGADWLRGVIIRLSEQTTPSWAAAYAVRRQLTRLKEAGKRVVITTPSLTNITYYLASAGDELVVPESAEFSVMGTALTITYKAELLERFGVRVEKLSIKEYKSAMDDLARREMSDADREQLDALLESLLRTFARDVGGARSRDEGEVRAWVDEAITSAERAAEVGMVDRVAYEDELVTEGVKPFAAGARFLRRPLVSASPKRVALVSLEGAIVPGKSRRSPVPLPLIGGTMAGSETLVRALRAAGKDKRTAAVVFHVESGGGSPLASDMMWREVKLLAKRMPVVAVMGSVAASGGYYVLTHASKVVAAPGTITGSIGVVTGKFVLQEFNDRYGLNPEVVKRGRLADYMSSARPFSKDEVEHVSRYMQEVYDRFVARVAEGRGIEPERVNEIGRGRIYSGVDALELGLVDRIGDLESGIAWARELAGLPEDAAVWSVKAPPKYVLPVGSEPEAALEALAPLLNERALLVAPLPGTRAGYLF